MVRKGDRMLAQKFGTGLARGFFVKGTLRPIIRHYVHPQVTGLENLSGLAPPLILAANHSSHMDTPLILNSLPRELRHRTLVVAASDYFFANRMFGIFVSVAVGAVPLDRRVVTKQNLAAVEQLLEQNWCLIVYPEGGRTLDGRLYKGRTGIARLALTARVPVIPVGVKGTYGSMPAGRSWPIAGHAEVRFGKPLDFGRYQHGTQNRIVLRAVTDEIMYQIMVLGGLNYVDEYVSDVKARKQGTRTEPAQTAGSSGDVTRRRGIRRHRPDNEGLRQREARFRSENQKRYPEQSRLAALGQLDLAAAVSPSAVHRDSSVVLRTAWNAAGETARDSRDRLAGFRPWSEP
jgi:1-acyl-sn-glycerol-3-phosphate acyltransferase